MEPIKPRIKCEADGCQAEKTGVCAYHNMEIERRQDTKETINSILKKLPEISKKVTWVLAVLSVSGVALIGAYGYITLTNSMLREDSANTRKEFRDDLFILRKEYMQGYTSMNENLISLSAIVRELAISVSQRETVQVNILKDLASLTSALKATIERQQDYERKINQRLLNGFDLDSSEMDKLQ